MRRPDFFVVGAPKCGTTSLNEYLKEHPEIFVPDRKEPHFFGRDIYSPAFIRDEDKYLSLFSGASNEKRAGEASVWYLYSEHAASEIKEFNPHASIIAMLRDPVEMMRSLHSHWLYAGDENIADFGEALAAEDERKSGSRIPNSAAFPEGLHYREAARYTRQLRRYLDAFGKERLHVIIYDDLKADTARVYEDTLRFLGVNTSFRPDFRIVNANKQVRSTALHKFSNDPPSFARTLVKSVMPRPIRRRLGINLKRYNTKYEVREELDPKLSRSLRAEFSVEVEQLSELLGRDLSFWSNP